MGMQKSEEFIRCEHPPLDTPKGRRYGKFNLLTSSEPPRRGELCPICKAELLDYDGLLNLSCPRCGAVTSGCFT